MIARAVFTAFIFSASWLGAPPEVAANEPSSDGDVAAAPGGDERALQVRVFGGAGVGTRDFSWPAPGQRLRVETGVFAALELGGSFLVGSGASFAFGVELLYQTSIAHEVEEPHVAGESELLRIRSHRFDGVIAAAIALGTRVRLTPAIGAAVQNLRPEVHHLRTPTFTLGGPLLRLGLRIAFADAVALRLAPEVQYVLGGEEIEDLGLRTTGFAFGGEVAIELTVSRAISIELAARDARAVLGSALGPAATDTGMFATTRVVWLP